jgi:outer membrane protein
LNRNNSQFKKRMRPFLISFLIIFISGMNAYGLNTETTEQNKWTLADLYQRALDLSETIKIAEKDFVIAQKDKDRAFSVLVPQITGFGGYTHYDEEKILFPESDWNWGVRFDQSFTLNGKELIALDMAEYRIDKTNLDLDHTRETYLFQVASAYFTLLKAIKREEIAQANVKRLETHREAVLVQLQLENTPKTELYSTEANLSGSRTELVVATNDIFISRAILARLIDLPKGFKLVTSIGPEIETVEQDIKELQQSALAQREDLQSIKIAHKLSESNIKLSKGAYWPTLSLEGGYTGMESRPDSFTPDEDYLFIGAKINFPIYDGGLRKAEVGQARIRSKQAELLVKDYSKQVSVEVESTYRTLKMTESAIHSLQDKHKWANENFNAVALQFQTGTKNSLDMIDANTLLTESERELAEARYIYSIAFLGFQKAQGIFLENIIEKYDLKLK